MPRDRVVPRIGTFACRTFHRDTKASKRANLPARDNELKVTTKELFVMKSDDEVSVTDTQDDKLF
jgi:hypothetical protein